MSETKVTVGTSAKLVELVYELLDAHDDTMRLAQAHEHELPWAAHIEYLQRLQRVGRALMAEGVE